MQERFLAARRIEVIWICLGSCAKFLHRLIISMESNVSRVKLHPLKELLEDSLEEQRSLPRTSRRPSRSVTKLGSEPWWNQTWFPLRHPVMRSSPDVKVRIPAAAGRRAAPAPRAALAARRVALPRWTSVFRGTQKFLQGLNEVCFNFHWRLFNVF